MFAVNRLIFVAATALFVLWRLSRPTHRNLAATPASALADPQWREIALRSAGGAFASPRGEQRPTMALRSAGGAFASPRGEQRPSAAVATPHSAIVSDPLGYYNFRWEESGAEHAVPAVAPPTADQCGTMPHTDFDGTASFSWGYGPKGLKAQTAGDCCKKCQVHAQCNTWSWCGEPLCFAPDIWCVICNPRPGGAVGPCRPTQARRLSCSSPQTGPWLRNHSFGECWLKRSPDPTSPLVNMRGAYTDKYRTRHPSAPRRVQWTAGVVKWRGRVTNGTWSGRAGW